MTLIIRPRIQDIGFPVRRLLPSRQRQRVGPFIFLDHMGPATFAANTTAGDVRQHPHIGLATVTYLFSGAMMHRDSLGVMQRIEPGAINLMTAGRGIVHSERIPADIRQSCAVLQGLQMWLALPSELEEVEPAFDHYAMESLPVIERPGVKAAVVVGALEGHRSAVRTLSLTTFLDLQIAASASVELQIVGQELAVYMAHGSANVNGFAVSEHDLIVLDDSVDIRAVGEHCRAVVLGGEPLTGTRHIHWNFVSSSAQRLQQAASDWTAGRFTLVPGETDRMPIPG